MTFLSYCLERGLFSHSISNPAVVGKGDGNGWVSVKVLSCPGVAVLGFKKLQRLKAPESRPNTGAVLLAGSCAPKPQLAWGPAAWIVSLWPLPASVVSWFMSLPPAPGAEVTAVARSFLKMARKPDCRCFLVSSS